jgi:hypothetical protein
VCKFAEENNRIPVFWDDMPLKFGGVYETTYKDGISSSDASGIWEKGTPRLDSLLKDFPKNCVYMRWNYSMARQPGNLLALDWYKSRGLKAMVATATNTEGGMFFQEDEREKGMSSSGIISIRSFIQLAAEKNISGALCTAWDDKSPHMENYWRGFIAAAEYSWSPDGRTLDEYDNAWLQREFGIALPDYKLFSDQLRKGSVLWYEAFFRRGSQMDERNVLQSLPQVEHWLPPVEGREKTQFDYTSKLIELPDPESPGSWTRKYKDRLDRSVDEMNNYKVLSDRLKEICNSSKRNRYYWTLSLALYNLQSSAPGLLLALRECDIADKEQRKSGIENLKKAMKNFQIAWNEVEDIYSQTRFIAYPVNYVPDRYFHLASQREDLTWMIQPEELFLGMIDTWLKKVDH